MKIFRSVLLVSMLLALLCSAVSAQELTLYTIPAPSEINWTSPNTLLRGAVANNLTTQHKGAKRAIGHVFIQLKHEGRGELILTGSSTQKDADNSKDLVLKEGYGLGILFHGIPGRLEKTQDLLDEIPDRFKSGKISYIRFLLNDATYDRLKTYLEVYTKRGYGNIYNGLNRPREGLGAGCSAFGIGFLEVAGLMHPTWRERWPVRVRIPMELIGGTYNSSNKVSVWSIVKARRWAEAHEPHMLLELYEPVYIHQWILEEWRKEFQAKTGRVKLLKRDKAFGLEYDCRHLPTPTEPIFEGEAAKIQDH